MPEVRTVASTRTSPETAPVSNHCVRDATQPSRLMRTIGVSPPSPVPVPGICRCLASSRAPGDRSWQSTLSPQQFLRAAAVQIAKELMYVTRIMDLSLRVVLLG